MTGQTIQDLGVFAKGEAPENLIVTIIGTDGSVLDLTGFTPKVAIAVIEGTGAVNLGGGTPTVVSPETDGKVQYVWHDDDFANIGLFRLQIWASDGTNDIASELFQYAVEEITTKPSFA